MRTVHSVEGQPYIPGSSIKGALRTGLLFSLLLQEDRLRNAAWTEVSRIINDNRLRDENSAFARLAQKLEIVLLHRLKIPEKRVQCGINAAGQHELQYYERFVGKRFIQQRQNNTCNCAEARGCIYC